MTSSDAYVPREQPRTERIALRGIDYHITRWGSDSRPLVVYLHGWGDTGSTFQQVADTLADRWQLLAPDWRGFGRSSHAVGGYWFPDYLADLDALLEHYSPRAPVALIGHSMGGNVAGLYAGVRPQRVRSFMNVEGFGLPDADTERAPARYADWLTQQRTELGYRRYTNFDELAARVRSRAPNVSPAYASFVAREWGEEANGQVSLRMDPRHRLPNPILYRRAEASACWGQIEASVALVLGEDSPFAATADEWANALPGGTAPVHRVAGAGHMLHFEAAEELADVLHRQLSDWNALD